MTSRESTMMLRATQSIFQGFQVSYHYPHNPILLVCKRPFTSVVMKINCKDGVLVVSLRDKNVEEEFQECFRIDQHIDMSYEKFFFVSATSGMALNNHHYINSIKAYDLD
jgi:hypothetical protein